LTWYKHVGRLDSPIQLRRFFENWKQELEKKGAQLTNSDMETKTIRTVCRECRSDCGMLVHIRGGRAIKVEIAPDPPKSMDKLCLRAELGLERLYHPARLQYPQKRVGERGEGKWQRISWDEALDTIAREFTNAKERYGAESVALAKGFYDRHADFVARLGNVFGTPNVTSIDNTCYIPSAVGRLVTYGFDGTPDISGRPDCILCWGSGANPPIKPGGKLIVINTLPTEAAKRADIWLRPRPATDLALALGMLHIIVDEGLYDKDFVDKWTTGFDKLEEHLREYSPEKVAEITWVPAGKIVEAARLFTSYSHACLMNGNASEDSYNSTQCARAFSIIQAICGLLEIPGGTVKIEGAILFEATGEDILRKQLPKEQEAKKLGAAEGLVPPHDLWDSIVCKPVEIRYQHLLRAILEGKPYSIQALGIFASNPLLTWTNSKKVYAALKKVNFLAVTDLVMTPTAALADIVLPAASYLESDAAIVSGSDTGVYYVKALQKVAQIGECRSIPEIIIDLASRLRLGNYFSKDLQTFLSDYLKPLGMTFDELRRRFSVASSNTRYRQYYEKGFNTPSGKVEIYSSLFKQWGYEPLPVYHEPAETPVSSPELLKEYPMILTTAHEADYTHSQDRYLEGLRKHKPNPLATIHPETARKLRIGEGDSIYIENKRGRIKQTATLSEGIDPRVVNAGYCWWFPERDISEMYGWDEANVNILTDDTPPYSPEMGSPQMRGFLCKVYKAEQ
jgi:anaerobic selenocysteine-containing dehydrogenase